jgi:hypothetical protein
VVRRVEVLVLVDGFGLLTGGMTASRVTGKKMNGVSEYCWVAGTTSTLE